MKRYQEIGLSAAVPVALAAVVAGSMVANATERPGPVVRCADGQVPEGAGYIAGVSNVDKRHHLRLGAAAILDIGSDLNDRSEDGAYPNQWIHLGLDSNDRVVISGFGACENASTPPSPATP